MAFWIEIAKFLAGFVASDMIAHASFLASKVEPKALGIHFTNRKNKAIVVLDLILLVLFVYVGWLSGWQL